jgi:hypothetical protein
MNKKLFILLFIASIYAQIDGEVVHNVQASQRTDGSKILDVSYELYPNELYTSYDINISIQGGDFTEPFYLEDCFGDVFFGVSYTGLEKQASCYLTHPDLIEILSGDFYINVHANGYAASELPDSFEFVNYSHIIFSEGEAFRFNLYDCETLEEDIMNIFDEDLSDDPDFAIMKNEVSAQQYISFISSLLDNAISIENNDGYTINRTYNLENGKSIKIIYNQNTESGTLYGWSSNTSYPDQNPNWNNDSEYIMWLNLAGPTNDDGSYPHVYPLTEQNADYLSLVVSAGTGLMPIVNVTFEGALAFAYHYGLRLPTIDEMLRVGIPLYDFEDWVGGDYSNEHIIGSCNAANISTCSGELLSGNNGGVLPGIDVRHIIGNAAEFTYTKNGDIAFIGQSYIAPNQILNDDYEMCDVFDEDNMNPLENLYLNYYQLYIESEYSNFFDLTYYTYTPYIGFRCARTLSASE